MSPRRTHPRRSLLICLAVLLVSTLGPGGVSRFVGAPFVFVYETLMAPAARLGQVALRAADTSGVGPNHAVEQTLELDRAVQQNQRLRSELQQLREENARLRNVRALLGEGFRLIQARTAGGSDEGGRNVLRIDRGSGAGVAERQVVAYGPWLVGRVASVEPFTASVELVDSRGTTLEVRFAEPVLGGVERPGRHHVTWSESLGAFEVEGGLPRDTPVRAGDRALLSDPGWPREANALFVGQVDSIDPFPADPDLRLRVVVRPAASLGELSRVDVVTPGDTP
ncbi:MAG: rod shape-determining protein MreC [Planctomycetota bacterium]